MRVFLAPLMLISVVALQTPSRGGVISGRILDPNGRPAAAANVTASRVFYQDGRPSIAPVKTATSDDRGEYRLYWLEPGDYVVLADKDLANGPARGFFPGGDDGRAAIKVRVADGIESGKIDFSLAPFPATVNVSGLVANRVAGFQSLVPQDLRAVADAQAGPALNYQFYLMPLDGARVYDGITPFPNSITSSQDLAAGKFELRKVRSGTYELYAVFQDRSVSPLKYYVAHTRIDVGFENVEGVALTVGPGIDLKGTVRVPDRVPLNSVRVRVRPTVIFPNFTGVSPTVSADGSFELPNLPEGRYLVSIESDWPNSYVSELFQGQNSILESGTLAVFRGLPYTVNAVIEFPAATVAGTVSRPTGQFTAGGIVTLVPEDDRRENLALYKRAIVKGDGAFSFSGVPPGRYKLFAWDRIPDGAEQNAEFMEEFLDSGTEIVAVAGKTSSVELRLTSK